MRTWKLSKKQKKERELDIAALRKNSVLVIDPDEKSARILLWRLESIGASVTKERNGTRGLELISTLNPSVLIADALLTDVSADDIYTHAASVGLPVVFVGATKKQRADFLKFADSVVCLSAHFDPEDAIIAAGKLVRRTGKSTTLVH